MSVNKIIHKSCTGCSACYNSCPKKCITMIQDSWGFEYPVINTKQCVDCNMCEKACPILSRENAKCIDQEVYAAWSLDREIRFTSTSGGIFSELAYSMVQQNSNIVAAAYDDNNMVIHTIVSEKDGISGLRQSKYIQSRISNAYADIKLLLSEGKKVLFCGSPCQVAGLKTFLGNDNNNLYTIDFICRGVNSPRAYSEWLKEIENGKGVKVTRVWFKYKENGWKKSPYCTRVDFADGLHEVYSDRNNYFMRGYLEGNLYMRPSCGECQFKGAGRYSDITLADFWSVDDKLDDDQGTSMVLLNTEKGRKLFDTIKDRIVYEKREIDEILEGNVCFNSSVTLNDKSTAFFDDLDKMRFSSAVEKYTHVPFSNKVKGKAKKIIKKISNISTK